MAQPSIFQKFIEQFMPVLGLYITEKVNGKSERERTYLFKQRLTPVYSPDQKWEGTSANTRYVAADYVALDSPLPLTRSQSRISTPPSLSMYRRRNQAPASRTYSTSHSSHPASATAGRASSATKSVILAILCSSH